MFYMDANLQMEPQNDTFPGYDLFYFWSLTVLDF